MNSTEIELKIRKIRKLLHGVEMSEAFEIMVVVINSLFIQFKEPKLLIQYWDVFCGNVWPNIRKLTETLTEKSPSA